MSSLYNNFFKIDSQNVTTQMDDFKRRLCAQTQYNYKPTKRLICLKWILKFFSTILHSQFNYHKLPVTLWSSGRSFRAKFDNLRSQLIKWICRLIRSRSIACSRYQRFKNSQLWITTDQRENGHILEIFALDTIFCNLFLYNFTYPFKS